MHTKDFMISVLPHQSGGNFDPTRGQKWALEALRGGFRAPEQAQKEAQRRPGRVPNGASEKGKDDPEAEGLKKEGAKSSKMGTIQNIALNVYGEYIFKE